MERIAAAKDRGVSKAGSQNSMRARFDACEARGPMVIGCWGLAVPIFTKLSRMLQLNPDTS